MNTITNITITTYYEEYERIEKNNNNVPKKTENTELSKHPTFLNSSGLI